MFPAAHSNKSALHSSRCLRWLLSNVRQRMYFCRMFLFFSLFVITLAAFTIWSRGIEGQVVTSGIFFGGTDTHNRTSQRMCAFKCRSPLILLCDKGHSVFFYFSFLGFYIRHTLKGVQWSRHVWGPRSFPLSCLVSLNPYQGTSGPVGTERKLKEAPRYFSFLFSFPRYH